MSTQRWPALLGALIGTALLILFFLTPGSAQSQSPSATPTGLIDVPPLVNPREPQATPTRQRSQLASPTPTATIDLPAPLLTLTSVSGMFQATMNAKPTATPGPSAIELDGKPHFVEFYADWCAPCRQQKPSVEAMRKKYGEQVTFWYINIDNRSSRALNSEYRVEFIPLVVLLDKDGNEVNRLEGLQTLRELETAIVDLIESAQ